MLTNFLYHRSYNHGVDPLSGERRPCSFSFLVSILQLSYEVVLISNFVNLQASRR